MPTSLLLFPAGGTAREALDCLGTAYSPLGFVDDNPALHSTRVCGLPVWGREAFTEYPHAKVLAVQASPETFRVRVAVIQSLGLPPERFATVVHPAAQIGHHVRLGHNVLVMAGAVLTANAVLEDHVIVLPNTTIHHDSRIATGTFVGSNVVVAGHAVVGAQCFIGSGARIRNGVRVWAGTLVGMGSVVVADAAPNSVYVGNPARRIHENF